MIWFQKKNCGGTYNSACSLGGLLQRKKDYQFLPVRGGGIQLLSELHHRRDSPGGYLRFFPTFAGPSSMIDHTNGVFGPFLIALLGFLIGLSVSVACAGPALCYDINSSYVVPIPIFANRKRQSKG